VEVRRKKDKRRKLGEQDCTQVAKGKELR